MKTERVVIDATTYEIQQLGAREGRRVLARLTGLIGPAIEELARQDRLNETAVAAAIGKLTKAIDPTTLDELCDKFAACTRVQTEANKWPKLDDIFDHHFAGRYLHMTKWLWECLQINFSDFLAAKELTGLLGAVAGQSASKSQTASTGSSGES